MTPFSDEVIEEMAKAGKKDYWFFPAFVADCGDHHRDWLGIPRNLEEHGGETVQLWRHNTEPTWVSGLVEFIKAKRLTQAFPRGSYPTPKNSPNVNPNNHLMSTRPPVLAAKDMRRGTIAHPSRPAGRVLPQTCAHGQSSVP